jgi:hypothetical protein
MRFVTVDWPEDFFKTVTNRTGMNQPERQFVSQFGRGSVLDDSFFRACRYCQMMDIDGRNTGGLSSV